MSKSAEAFRTISEVADLIDTPAHVLRFWESRFSQIKPIKRAGGRRYYRPADVALLTGIKKLLHEDGLTIRGVQKILRVQGIRHVSGIAGIDLGEEAPDSMPAAPTAAPTAATPAPTPAFTAPLPDTRMVTPAETAGTSETDGTNDLFASPRAMPSKPASAPLGKSLSDTAPGYEARAGLQRDREAAAQLQNPVPRGSRPDVPLEEGDFLPAAALLRAMTVYRASQKRTELRAIYKRLSELHARRSALGHRADD